MRIKNIHILALLFLVLGVSVLLFTSHLDKAKSPKVLGSQDLEEIIGLRDEWRKELNTQGAGKLWERLKRDYQNNYHRHSVAHIFGELVYEEMGIGGIAVCDETFSWGCYHSFFGKAFAERGLAILPELDKACREKSGGRDSGCQHGIGHGLAQYFGSQKLASALTSCEGVSVNGDSCVTGVFMEYNFPTEVIGISGTAKVRELDVSSPYEPCFAVEEKFRGPCFYELPRLWGRVFASDFAKVGKLCDGLAQTTYKERCFGGVGEVVSLVTDHQVKESISQCQKMPDEKSVSLCQIAASWGFYSLQEHQKDAFSVCRGLSREDQAKCAKL